MDSWTVSGFGFYIHNKPHRLQSLHYKACSVLTVEVRGDGVAGQEAVDGNLIDDVEQQEGHTGEAEGLQQTPCVAWRRRRVATVSSSPQPLTLRISTCYFCRSSTETQKKPLCMFIFLHTVNEILPLYELCNIQKYLIFLNFCQLFPWSKTSYNKDSYSCCDPP